MKYPKVGEKFYWKDQEGNISEETCLKIEGDDIPTLETMFFISLTKNGGGCFVTESDILNPNSEEVINFKKELAIKKVRDVEDYISQKEVRDILLEKLCTILTLKDASKILNILSNNE